MLQNKTIGVVVPCFNEENQIGDVIETMPEFVDRIVVVNDYSADQTSKIVEGYINTEFNVSKLIVTKTIKTKKRGNYDLADNILLQRNLEEIKYFVPSEITNKTPDKDRIILINHLKNGGVGAAISRGYKWCKDNEIDCAAVMAGDGQMDPEELESICRPVIEDGVDYVKGNRLRHAVAFEAIPKTRFLGNSILSILTKIASGYWHISDPQTGFTAISKNALNAITLYKIYSKYGMPNDLLVKLNIAYCSIKEVTIKPVYNIGEKSKMKVFQVILPIMILLVRSFFQRLWIKYLFKSFHPLFLLYHMGLFLLCISIPFLVNLLSNFFKIGIMSSEQVIILYVFLTITGLQSLLFAMWMDIQDNENLNK